MAIKIFEKFAPRANPADGNYPHGSIKNESVPGARDGTPLDATWGNDYAGFDAALLAEAGITPSGSPDTALASQRLDAIKGIFSASNGAEKIGREVSTVDADLTALETTSASLVSDVQHEANQSPSRAIQLLNTGMYLQNNHSQGVTNIGDSISHGAYSGNAYTNHWLSLLQRSVNAQFGAKNLGTLPMEGVYNVIPELNTPQIHDVTFSAGWGALSANPAPYNYPLGNFGAAAANIVNGKSYSSSTSDSSITIVIPTMQERVAFRYTQQAGGGVFNVSINGNFADTINTNGSLTHNVLSVPFPIIDDGTGKCTIVLTKADSMPTEINAVINYSAGANAITDLPERMSVHNYSQSGRQLLTMSESAIIQACNSACLIVSLGYNDWDPSGGDTDNNQTNFDAFKQRIDWLIQYCNVYKNLVVVNDFIWYPTLENSRTRRELKRLADACAGIYIPYADRFFSDETRATVAAGPRNLNDPIFLWADAAHPNPDGNSLIFSAVAVAMGLGVTCKNDALNNHDLPFPISITNTGYRNTATSSVLVSTVKRCSGGLMLSLDISATSGNLPDGALINISSGLPAKFGYSGNIRSSQFVISSNFAGGSVLLSALIENNASVTYYATTALTPTLTGTMLVATVG